MCNLQTFYYKNVAGAEQVPSSADVVVIGGGSLGCSALYHLTKHGVTNAVLLEANKLTAGTAQKTSCVKFKKCRKIWQHPKGRTRNIYSPNVPRLKKIYDCNYHICRKNMIAITIFVVRWQQVRKAHFVTPIRQWIVIPTFRSWLFPRDDLAHGGAGMESKTHRHRTATLGQDSKGPDINRRRNRGQLRMAQ